MIFPERPWRRLMGGALAALITLGDAAAQTPSERSAQVSGSLSREDAVKLVKAVLAANKLDGPGLNEKNLGGLDVNGQPIYFEYLPEKKVLRTHALCYRFRRPPRPGVLDGFRKEEVSGTNTGGGSVEFQPENGGLYLSRTYAAHVDPARFVNDTERLVQAGREWAREVVPRVSTRVFHPGDR